MTGYSNVFTSISLGKLKRLCESKVKQESAQGAFYQELKMEDYYKTLPNSGQNDLSEEMYISEVLMEVLWCCGWAVKTGLQSCQCMCTLTLK